MSIFVHFMKGEKQIKSEIEIQTLIWWRDGCWWLLMMMKSRGIVILPLLGISLLYFPFLMYFVRCCPSSIVSIYPDEIALLERRTVFSPLNRQAFLSCLLSLFLLLTLSFPTSHHPLSRFYASFLNAVFFNAQCSSMQLFLYQSSLSRELLVVVLLVPLFLFYQVSGLQSLSLSLHDGKGEKKKCQVIIGVEWSEERREKVKVKAVWEKRWDSLSLCETDNHHISSVRSLQRREKKREWKEEKRLTTCQNVCSFLSCKKVEKNHQNCEWVEFWEFSSLCLGYIRRVH